MRSLLLGAVASLSVSFAAQAAPVSLFGIELGAPLPVKECPAKHSSNATATMPCYVRNDNRDPQLVMYSIPVEKRPHYLSNGYFGIIVWLDHAKNVQSISLDVNPNYHKDALAALEKKFGKATQTPTALSHYHWDVPGASLDYTRDWDSSEIRMETPAGKHIREDFAPDPVKIIP